MEHFFFLSFLEKKETRESQILLVIRSIWRIAIHISIAQCELCPSARLNGRIKFMNT